MVETDGIVSGVVGKAHVKDANAIIEHLKKGTLLATESVGWGDPAGLAG